MVNDESVGAWNAQSDPDPQPGQPPRNVTPMQRAQPPGERPALRDPNAPTEGTPTAKSFGGGAMPERAGLMKRCVWVTIPYYGWHVLGWVNVPEKLLNDKQKQLGRVLSPDAANVDPDDPALDPQDFALDPNEYGISNAERMARVAEIERRTKEVDRRRQEKARRQEAFDTARADLARFFGEIVMEHDITDTDGNLLPPADTVEFWDAIEGEPQDVIMTTLRAQRGKLNPQSARR